LHPSCPPPRLPHPLRRGLLLLLLTAASTLAGEKVVLHAGWYPSPQLAGIFVALDRGFYREAGLDVRIEPFAFGLNSPARIDADPSTCALGTIEGYIFLQKRNAGVNLQALAAMLQESPAGYMSLASSHIKSACDFAGRRVGVHHYAEPIYAWFVQRAGLAPDAARMMVVEDDVTLLTRGELDVMQGYATEEFVRLQALCGNRGEFLTFAQLGFPSYSEILYTTGTQVDGHAATLHAFLAATRQGWAEAFAHPDQTVAILARHLGANADPTHLARALTALQPYVCPDGQPAMAPMTAEKWRALQEAGTGIGLLKRTEPVEKFLRNW
jgi:ABC-type nitrate/sulfonate/bicarbonate transport system substrate-binding protein